MAPSDKPVGAMTSPDIFDLPLDCIRVGPGRHRQDMGDLQTLADSMSEIGLLQPIGVTADFALVFGERRLRAAGMLGWTTVAARIVDLPSILASGHCSSSTRTQAAHRRQGQRRQGRGDRSRSATWLSAG